MKYGVEFQKFNLIIYNPVSRNIPGVPVLKVHIYIFEFQKKNGGKNYITEIF